MTYSEASLVFDVDASNIEAALWATHPESCDAAGADVVEAIALAIGSGLASQVQIPASIEKLATELIESARFLAALAGVSSAFAVREGRLANAQDLVHEARRQRLSLPAQAHQLTRAFIAQRIVC